MNTNKTITKFIDNQNQSISIKKQGSVTGITVKWLSGDEIDSTLIYLFKKTITVFLSLLLAGSLVGIPLLIMGAIEWKSKLARKNDWKQKLSQETVKLVQGTQGNSSGITEKNKVNNVLEQLNQNLPSGIYFNKAKVTGKLEGGICSAISLGFAYEYTQAKKKNNFTSLKKLAEKVTTIANNNNFYRFPDSERLKEYRNIQEAFNCIEVDKSKNTVDFSRAKIQALANCYFLKITHSSKKIIYKQGSTDNTQKLLSEEIKKLPYGVHLLRDILPEKNEKLEKHGHSMVLIKEKIGVFFFDPNYGLRLFNKNIDSQVFEFLKKNNKFFQVTDSHFYTLSSKD